MKKVAFFPHTHTHTGKNTALRVISTRHYILYQGLSSHFCAILERYLNVDVIDYARDGESCLSAGRKIKLGGLSALETV